MRRRRKNPDQLRTRVGDIDVTTGFQGPGEGWTTYASDLRAGTGRIIMDYTSWPKAKRGHWAAVARAAHVMRSKA